ncbi:TerC family protein [Brevibacillus daliensis]|uniref:TerC family protein n=1 Tax=Brevibacillus daliensis TaxID=2892995 RepID=UPI001E5A9867|nr:TerC family protein [Brevibacillus daliensis]
METEIVIALLNILVIDLVLSGDNAVVIGMACQGLAPADRKKAIMFGTLGAVVLRVLLTLVAAFLLTILMVKAVGGIMLVGIALKLLSDKSDGGEEIGQQKSMSTAIKTIIMADLVMSLDNVLAVGGAAHGNFLLVLFGLAVSIPLLMVGSNMIATLLNKYPSLMYVGVVILAHTAITMFLSDPIVDRFMPGLIMNNVQLTSIILSGLILAYGIWRKKAATTKEWSGQTAKQETKMERI